MLWQQPQQDAENEGKIEAKKTNKRQTTVYVVGAIVIVLLVAALVIVSLRDSIWPRSNEPGRFDGVQRGTVSVGTDRTQEVQYEWKWLDDDKTYKLYQPDKSQQLSSLEIDQTHDYSRSSYQYEIRKMSEDTAQQTNHQTGKVREVKRFTVRPLRQSREFIFNIPNDEYYQNEKSYRQLTDQDVLSEFQKTTPSCRYDVFDVEVLKVSGQNAKYEASLWTKCSMMRKPRSEVEKYLWHGSDYATTNLIIANGFDRSYSTVDAYGKGNYFARDSSYSATGRYCPEHSDGYKYILLCKVIVGDSVQVPSGCGEQTITLQSDGSEYDTHVDNSDDPAIYVTWRDYTAVPMYRLKFKERP